MKAITISQPYATLIADGEKWVENRKWATSYRGALAIHAGKGTQYLTRQELAEYPSSCIVAICDLVACMPIASMRQISRGQKVGNTDLTLGDILDHEHAEGPYCWVLQNVRPLIPPVPYKGAQGLWEYQE
jgi:hypothetical protein